MTPSETTDIKPGFPFRRLGSDFKYAFVLNLIFALIITALSGSDYFLGNMVISMCIGTLAFLMIDGTRLALWGEQTRAKGLPFFALVALAVPVAYFAGTTIGGAIMGIPRSSLFGSSKMMGMLFVTLMATGGATLFFINREKIMRLEAAAAHEKAHAESVARQALQAQLQLLQAQIEPHMLFNTLSNLQGLIALDPQRAQVMLDQLIQYLRATLTSSRTQKTTLGQEFSLMQAYLGLMSVRMGQRLTYGVELPEQLRAISVPPMLLQPLVENAIRHGLEPKIEGGHIDICAVRNGQTLILTVSDTGLGLHHAGPVAGSHLGLSNIRERLLALHGAQAALSLTGGQPSGAIARLTLPLQTA